MKNVIVALTTAAVICAASASFAQTKPAAAKSEGLHNKRIVLVKIEGTGAVAGMSREVTVNGTVFTIKPGRNEASKEILLSGLEARKLMITYKGIACPASGVTVVNKPEAGAAESRVTTILLKLVVQPKAAGMKEEKTSCHSMITVVTNKPKRP